MSPSRTPSVDHYDLADTTQPLWRENLSKRADVWNTSIHNPINFITYFLGGWQPTSTSTDDISSESISEDGRSSSESHESSSRATSTSSADLPLKEEEACNEVQSIAATQQDIRLPEPTPMALSAHNPANFLSVFINDPENPVDAKGRSTIHPAPPPVRNFMNNTWTPGHKEIPFIFQPPVEDVKAPSAVAEGVGTSSDPHPPTSGSGAMSPGGTWVLIPESDIPIAELIPRRESEVFTGGSFIDQYSRSRASSIQEDSNTNTASSTAPTSLAGSSSRRDSSSSGSTETLVQDQLEKDLDEEELSPGSRTETASIKSMETIKVAEINIPEDISVEA